MPQNAEALIHGGRNSVAKVEEIPVSDTTVYRRSLSIGEVLENQLLLKLRKAPSFGIQLDETTDVGSEAQLLVFCRFPDVELNKISKHYLFRQPLGVNANSTAIFQKLDDYFKKTTTVGKNVSRLQQTVLPPCKGRLMMLSQK